MEERVLAQINRDELVAFTSDLVRIPSFSGEETAAARFVAEHLHSRGYEVDLQEVERGWFQTVAVLKGQGRGKSLMFNGHLDIEPLAEGWPRNPFEPWVEGNRLYGAGVRNMKSGVGAMIHAAEAVRKSGVKLAGDLVIATVLGELQGGVGTRHLLEKGYRTDGGIVTEPYGAHYIVTKHGGMTVFSLTVFGRHPDPTDLEGVNAIDLMARAIPAIQRMKMTYTPWPLYPGLPWVKVGSVIGGRGPEHNLQSPYRNADRCTALIHISTVPGQTPETLRADLTRVLEELRREDPNFSYELNHPPRPHFNAWRVDFPPTDAPTDSETVQAVLASYRRVTGGEPRAVGPAASDLGARYGDDDAHLWRAGIPSCIYGPAGGTYGVEYTLIDEMLLCSQVLALTALRFCG